MKCLFSNSDVVTEDRVYRPVDAIPKLNHCSDFTLDLLSSQQKASTAERVMSSKRRVLGINIAHENQRPTYSRPAIKFSSVHTS